MRVSRAPLREAMRELVQEGILTSIPYAGTFVIDVTAKDIDDAYSLNKVLDEFAIERTWKLRDQRFFDELDRRHEAVKQATRALDTTRQIETALQLHGLIYEWADNSVLLETWQRLTSRLQMYFALHQRARNEPVPAEDVHETYVRLLKGADMRAAQRHAREHIDLDFEELLAYARGLEQRTSKALTLLKPRDNGQTQCRSKPSRPIASCSPSSTGPTACRRGGWPTAFDAVIVAITADNGLTGWGEMAPLGNFYSAAFPAGARAGVAEIAPHLIGQDPRALARSPG